MVMALILGGLKVVGGIQVNILNLSIQFSLNSVAVDLLMLVVVLNNNFNAFLNFLFIVVLDYRTPKYLGLLLRLSFIMGGLCFLKIHLILFGDGVFCVLIG